MFFSPDGKPTYSENSVNKRIGKSIEYVVDITTPGFDGEPDHRQLRRLYRRATQLRAKSLQHATQAQVARSRRSRRWLPSPVGKRAVVGHQVKVSKTRAPDCKVTYKWKVNGQKVATGRSLMVRQNMNGRPLKALITVGKGQAKKTKALSYGRVASARS